MLGIGFAEFALILIAALIIIGPDKLPEIARTLGRAYVEFKKTADDLKNMVTEKGFLDAGNTDDNSRKAPTSSGDRPSSSEDDVKAGGTDVKSRKNEEAT